MSKQLVGKYRKSTRYRVEFPTLPSFVVPPEFIELRQSAGHHDVLLLQYHNNRGNYFEQLKTGVPVKLTWSQGPRTRVWYGYVSVTTSIKAGQKIRPTKVFCIGGSFLLKDSKPRIFHNHTIPEVASLLAKESGLRFVGENHSTRWEQISISGGSYWQWLQDNAKKIGYACYVDNTDLVFRPIDKLIHQEASNLPIMQYWNIPLKSTNNALDRTLDSLEVLSGEYVEDTESVRSVKQVGGMDPITGQECLVRKSPAEVGQHLRSEISGVLFDEHADEYVATSPAYARTAVEGHAHLARFNLPAKIVGQGDPRIRPHSLVYIDGTGPQTDGAWLVRSVVHGMNRGGEYSVQIMAATDGLGASEIDFNGATTHSSTPIDRSIVGKIDIEQFLSSSTFSSGMGETTQTVKLPFGARNYQGTTVLKNTTNIDTLIESGDTTAKPGITTTPHLWVSGVPGKSLKVRTLS